MGFDLPLLNRRRRAGGFNPAVLFSAGEQGTIFDTNLQSTLFQDSTGTTPVTAVAQTVGLTLDNSKGLVLGPELVVNGSFTTDTNWTKGVGWTISGGEAVANIASGSNLDQSVTTTINKSYQIIYTIVTATSGGVRSRLTGATNINGSIRSTVGTYTELLYATATNSVFRISDGGAGFVGSIDNISVKELLGYHAIQGTLLSRPTYRNPSGVPYLEDDGGDSMNWTAPAGTYTIARVNSAGTVTILTAQALSGATDMLLDAQTTAYVAVNRVLTASETEMLTAWLRSRAGL